MSDLQPGYYVVEVKGVKRIAEYIPSIGFLCHTNGMRQMPLGTSVLAGPFTPEQVVAAMECGKLLDAALELFGEDSEAQEPGTDAYTWRYLAQDAIAAYNAAGKEAK